MSSCIDDKSTHNAEVLVLEPISVSSEHTWKGGRAVECTGLENPPGLKSRLAAECRFLGSTEPFSHGCARFIGTGTALASRS